MNQMPTISKSFTVEDFSTLQLHTFSGNIELVGHDENTVKVEVFISVRSIFTFFIFSEPVLNADTQYVSMNVANGNLIVNAKPDFWDISTWLQFPKISFRIYLPSSVHSISKTYGGNISIQNLKGNHTFNTWGGDLLLQNSSGYLHGRTMGGKIEVYNSEGQIVVKTMGGKIFVKENQGEINVDTKGGNIFIQNHKGKVRSDTWGGNIEVADIFGAFECSTLGGNIRLNNVNGNIGASTKGGNITADMPSVNQYAWFDTAGGNIKVAMPLDIPIDLEVSANKIYHPSFQNFQGEINLGQIRGKLNGGGVNVTIRTSGGKVNIENTTLPATKMENPVASSQPYENYTQPPKNEFNPQTKKAIPASNSKPFLQNLNELFFALLFCLLMVYGLSGVIYFTLEFVNPKSILSSIYKGVFYTNINNSIGALVTVYIFIHFYEYKIQSNVSKYLTLIGMTSIYAVIFQKIMVVLYWSQIDKTLWTKDQNNYNFLYGFVPMIVSCAYFFYWQRTSSITRKMSEQEYQLLNLEKLKSKAQLDALEARINPHFLYNSLNSIAGLIHDKPDKAEEMTIQLSKLFRYTTGRTDENFHTFADELEVIKAYLAIEQVRFGKRLTYSIDCDEVVLDRKIPRFLLQPLVENAIKHGIAKIAHAGEITIEIKQLTDTIFIKIHDNGPDFGEALGGGFGLRSIKEKLQIVFGDKATIDIKNEPEKAIIINLPALSNGQ
jgi:sensor histidine kinase YesM/DUF4097 and DUF4098 domain-containing protein YvlB